MIGLHAVTPYDPDNQFTISALSRLDDVGIPVITSLNTTFQPLQQTLSTYIPNAHIHTHPTSLLDAWLSYSDCVFSCPTPTWKNLLLIIHNLNLHVLYQQVETYLSEEAAGREDLYSDSGMSEAGFETENETKSESEG